MTKALYLTLIIAAVAVPANAAPQLFFSKLDLPAIRARVEKPQHAKEWQKILTRAKAYSDPESKDYADPENLYTRKAPSEQVSQQRLDAVLPHVIGQTLTKRMEALGLAYQITGDKRFGRHGARVLVGACRDYPVTLTPMAKGFAGGRGDTMYGLALGMDLLSECLTPEERAIVAPACRDYLNVFVEEFNNPKVWWYRVHNYNGVNGGAAGCLALTLRKDFPEESPVWIAEASKIVQRWLSNGFDADGAGLEGIGYAAYGLANSTVFGDALRRNGMGDFFDHPVYKNFPVFLALSKLPGERAFDARNDSQYAGFRISLLKLADVTGNGLYRWLWDEAGTGGSSLNFLWANDARPVSPKEAGVPRAAHFRGRGLCVWRTGWGKDSVMFSVEAGPYYPITHNQGDKGHFTLYGLGFRWATDSGYSNGHEEEGRGQTLAHSCVLIDGKGQALSGAGYGTNGRVLTFEDHARFGYALMDAKEAYTKNNRGIAGAGARRALRHALFVYPHQGAPAYAVVCDDIEKDDSAHEFTWQMMAANSCETTLEGATAVLAPFTASGHAFIGTPWTSPDDAVKSAPSKVRTEGTCAVAFEVAEAGEYVLWARVRTRAPERGKSDSFYVRVDDGQDVDWHMPNSPSWVWGQVAVGVPRDPFVLNLKPGRRLVTIRRREPGAEMDCLMLCPVDAPAPTMADAHLKPLFAEAESGTCTGLMQVERISPIQTRLELHLDATTPISLEKDIFRPKDRRGPAAFPRIRATITAVNPGFAAILLPLRTGIPSPKVTFSPIDGGRQMLVDWGEGRGQDEILWSDAAPRRLVLAQLR